MNNKAQTIVEYTMVIGVVMLILIAMNPLIRRGIQGMIVVAADQIGVQNRSDQDGYFNIETDGYMKSSHTMSHTILNKVIIEDFGRTTYNYDDESTTGVTTITDQGFRDGAPK